MYELPPWSHSRVTTAEQVAWHQHRITVAITCCCQGFYRLDKPRTTRKQWQTMALKLLGVQYGQPDETSQQDVTSGRQGMRDPSGMPTACAGPRCGYSSGRRRGTRVHARLVASTARGCCKCGSPLQDTATARIDTKSLTRLPMRAPAQMKHLHGYSTEYCPLAEQHGYFCDSHAVIGIITDDMLHSTV